MANEICANTSKNDSDIKKALEEVYFDIDVDGKKGGRIIFGLYGHVTPKTAKNFASICEGSEIGMSGLPLRYEGTKIHKIVPGVLMMGGDINGTGGESIYGNRFEDENFLMKHNQYVLSSTNSGPPNTNGSQFFITLEKQPWLDGRHTVFG